MGWRRAEICLKSSRGASLTENGRLLQQFRLTSDQSASSPSDRHQKRNDGSSLADVSNVSFVPPEIVSQFVEIGFPSLAEKHSPPIIRCFSQGIDKEGNPWHFISLSRRPRAVPRQNPGCPGPSACRQDYRITFSVSASNKETFSKSSCTVSCSPKWNKCSP